MRGRHPPLYMHSHLELRMALQPVGIVAVAAVVRPDGWLCVSDVPGLWALHPEEGGGVHGACAHLPIVWEHHSAAALRPVGLQPRDGLLEGRRAGRRHGRCMRGARNWGCGALGVWNDLSH
eukprot:366569-Chlamydomonas_euryale.AAC.36